QPPKLNETVSYSARSNLKLVKIEDGFILKIEKYDNNLGYSEQTIKNILSYPVRFELTNNGSVKDLIYTDENDSYGSIIVKKSLINLFNYDILNKKQDTLYGTCDVTSQILTQNSNLFEIKKHFFNCDKNNELKGEFKRKEKVLNSLIERNITIETSVSNNKILNSSSYETIKNYIEFNPKSHTFIQIKNVLRLISEENSVKSETSPNRQRELNSLNQELINYDLKIKGLTYDSEKKLQIDRTFEKSLKVFGKKFRLGSLETSEKFLDTIKLIQVYTDQKVLDNTLKNLIGKQKLGKFILETYTASQSSSALNSIGRALGIFDLETDRILDEKESNALDDFLFSSALTCRKNSKTQKLIEKIYQNYLKITSYDIKEKSLLALGAVTTDLEEFLYILTKELTSCRSEQCRIKILESAKNTKSQKIENIVIGLKSNCTHQKNVCLFAVKALGDLDIKNETLSLELLEIFNSDQYPIDLRIEALNTLFIKFPKFFTDSNLLSDILITIKSEIKKNLKSNEFITYVRKFLFNKLGLNENLLRDLKINLFDILVQNGASNSVTSVLKKFPSGFLGYNMNQLMSDGGFFKSLDFSVFFQGDSYKLEFIKFEIYGHNLNFMSTKVKGAKKDPVISLHLSLMGQKLKIVELFRGYSSMLSFMWSLPTVPTSLFNLNFLINDQNEYFFLSNGLSLRIENLASLGINLEGITEISLWSQYAKVNVKTLASLVNNQKLSLISDMKILNQIESNFKTQFLVNFEMNTNFGSNPYKVCVKMSQDKFYLKEAIKVLNSQFKVIKEISKKLPIQALSFMFSREAVKFC
ncbi:unnamed protein product, partial [Brachionus calyciflorus]